MDQTVQTRIIQIFLEDMQAIAQGQLHGYTHGKRPRDFARIPMVDPREHHPPELPLFFCGYPCTICEKCYMEHCSVNRMS
ncbi:hypothetical protein, partial [Phocaeicola vulgatus]|uniref:hypothetical protein n=1 Tax=Phocaeicola vulgatus TaxID=821 RepID=UPI001C2117F8